MTGLYLLRHGETKWNRLSKTQGCVDTDLSEEGLIQGRKLALRLTSENITAIYTSNLKRAYSTAQIIGQTLNIPINILPDLREMNFGRWEGMDIDSIKKKYYDIHRLWISDPRKARIPDAEHLTQVQDRAVKAASGIINSHRGDNIAVVSHGITLKCLIFGLLGMDLKNLSKIRIDNCSITLLKFEGGHYILNYLNDTYHMKG